MEWFLVQTTESEPSNSPRISKDLKVNKNVFLEKTHKHFGAIDCCDSQSTIDAVADERHVADCNQKHVISTLAPFQTRKNAGFPNVPWNTRWSANHPLRGYRTMNHPRNGKVRSCSRRFHEFTTWEFHAESILFSILHALSSRGWTSLARLVDSARQTQARSGSRSHSRRRAEARA